MKKKTKYDQSGDTILSTRILYEVIEFVEKNGGDIKNNPLDFDIDEFYEHCQKNVFKKFIITNVDKQAFSKEYMEWECDIHFLLAMNHINMNNKNKAKVNDLAKKMVEKYGRYLNY